MLATCAEIIHTVADKMQAARAFDLFVYGVTCVDVASCSPVIGPLYGSNMLMQNMQMHCAYTHYREKYVVCVEPKHCDALYTFSDYQYAAGDSPKLIPVLISNVV